MHKFSRWAATAAAVAAFATTAAAQAHGAGKGAGKTPNAATHAPKRGGQPTRTPSDAKAGSKPRGSEAKAGRPSRGKSDDGSTPKGSRPATISTKIAKNAEQLARVNAMLPAGMTIEDASAGFRNQGQFIAALNASKNRNIDFVQLKQAMTVDGLSLGEAARQLRPSEQ